LPNRAARLISVMMHSWCVFGTVVRCQVALAGDEPPAMADHPQVGSRQPLPDPCLLTSEH